MVKVQAGGMETARGSSAEKCKLRPPEFHFFVHLLRFLLVRQHLSPFALRFAILLQLHAAAQAQNAAGRRSVRHARSKTRPLSGCLR